MINSEKFYSIVKNTIADFKRSFFLTIAFIILLMGILPASECGAVTLPTLQIGLDEADSPQKVSTLIEILLLFTILSMAPAILLMMT